MSSGFKATFGTQDIANAKDDEIAVDTTIGTLLISSEAVPPHQAIYTYKFTANLANGTYPLFAIPHGFDYQPDGLAMIRYDDATLGGGLFEGQFAILPLLQVGAGNTEFKYKITGRYLEVSVEVSLGGAFNLANRSYDFKYIIFVNSKDSP